MLIAFGPGYGSDAGYWVFVDGKLRHVGGWSPVEMNEVTAALQVLAASTLVENKAASGEVVQFAERMLAPHRGYLEKAETEAARPG